MDFRWSFYPFKSRSYGGSLVSKDIEMTQKRDTSSVGVALTSPKVLTGFQFLLEGFTEQEIRQLRTVIVGQGANAASGWNAKISCVIAKVVGGPIFRQSVKQHVPAVTPQWLIDCATQKRWIPFSEYIIPPFFGLIISTTGFDISDRDEIKVAVERFGGIFMKDLMKGTTTHLVCLAPSGAKYESAKTWGDIKIVNAHWIVDCVEMNQWQPEEQYPATEIDLQATSDVFKEPTAEAVIIEAVNEYTKMELPDSKKRDISQVATVPSTRNPSKQRTVSTASTVSSGNTKVMGPENKLITEAIQWTSAEQFLVDNMSHLSLPQLLDSGAISDASGSSGDLTFDNSVLSCETRRTLFKGCLVFLSGYPEGIRQYFQRLILFAGGQVSVILNQDVHFVALYLPSSPVESSLTTLERVQWTQQQFAYHQRALRLTQQCGLQRINLLWCLEVLLGRRYWQSLVPVHLHPHRQTNSSVSFNHDALI